MLRASFDRLTEHEAAAGEKQLLRRRHDGRLAVVATDEVALAAAESVARRADELVTDRRDSVVAPSIAARDLRSAYDAAVAGAGDVGTRVRPPSDQRLVRLAAAISRRAAVSGRGELHSRFLEPGVALRLALSGLAQSEVLTRTEVRDRVAARFPALDRLPAGAALDAIVDRADLGLQPTEKGYRYPDATPPGSTSLVTRGPTITPGPATDAAPMDGVSYRSRLDESIREHAFLAIGVAIGERPSAHLRVAEDLARRFRGDLVDVTGAVIEEMRSCAREVGVDWELVRTADAAAPGTRDAQGLQALLGRVLPPVLKLLDEQIFGGSPTDAPLVLTEVSPLARYGQLGAIARWSDLAAARRRPVWLILPQMRRQLGPLVNGKPIQLSSPGGQFVSWGVDRALEKVN